MSYFVVCTRVNSYHAHRLPLCYVGRSIEQCDNSCHRCLCAGAVGGTRRSGRLIKQMSAGSRRARAQSPSPAHVATTDSSSRRYEAAVRVCLWPSTLCVCVCVCVSRELFMLPDSDTTDVLEKCVTGQQWKTSCARGDTICPAPLLPPWTPKRLARCRADATWQ